MVLAGKHYIEKKKLAKNAKINQILDYAIQYLGLDSIREFDPNKRIIEYTLGLKQLMIRSLPEELRNKIAAGEIVDGPSSIVKELIENSLDAGATEISVVVEKGRIQTIQVRDNGLIEADQLHAAVMPYHTSKINKFDDLFSIDTLGFRGEALASIASVRNVYNLKYSR